MRLVAMTYGTEGDTRPIAVLCRALMDAGHEVTLLAGRGTLSSAVEVGIRHEALAGDIRATLKSARLTTGTSNLDATARVLAGLANENADSWMSSVLDTSAGCDGVIVGGLAAYSGDSAAEKLGIPVVGASMIPLTPTKVVPSPFLGSRSVPAGLNRLTYRLVAGALWRAFRDSTNAARVRIGLRPGQPISDTQPIMYGISPTLLPVPADWPDSARICGQWTRSINDGITTDADESTWRPSRRLQQFLASGEPPIYVGFGSMAGVHRQGLLATVVAGVAGRRALFYPGWSTAEALELPANFCVIDDTPHDWLFPRTSMIIHHGGSGTTHSAARAGVPSIVLPFAADQFFWAKRLQQLGVAPAVLHGRRLTAERLSAAIDAAKTTQMRQRAATVGATMRAEDGPGIAVRAFPGLLALG